jgi:hypothetical protein
MIMTERKILLLEVAEYIIKRRIIAEAKILI